ncbi:MAG: ComEC family competence protein [Armatimonadota bacterium]|nr:MAG: ComEC family competence protein [Armatimonadota bacterium]
MNEPDRGLIASAVEEVRGRPLVCAVGLFALGIWVGARYDIGPALALGALGACMLAALALRVRRTRPAAAPLLITAALAGGVAYSVAQLKPAYDVSAFDGTARTVEAVIVSEPHRFGDTQSMAAEAHGCVDLETGAHSPASGRLWLACASNQPLERGDRVRFTAVIHTPREATNPGEVTRELALQAAGLSALAYVSDERLIQRLGRARLGAIERAGIAFRAHVSRVMRDSMPGPYRDTLGALLGSIVFGAKAHPLPPDVMEAFRRAGVVHILVVSGSQISLLFAIVYAPGALALLYHRRRYRAVIGDRGRVAPLPTQATLVVVLALIGVYALFTEGGRPVARAAIMGGVVAVGLILRRMPSIADFHPLEFDRYTIVALAALALLVVRPEGLFDIGLQLSLAAVLGLVYLGPKIMRWLSGLPRWLALTVGATVAAQLAVLPIMAWHFRYISPVGFIANLLVIPLAGFLLATGIAVCILGSVSIPLATAVNYVNAPLLLAMVRITHKAASLPWAAVTVATCPLWVALAYYAALIALGAALHGAWLRRRKDPDVSPVTP